MLASSHPPATPRRRPWRQAQGAQAPEAGTTEQSRHAEAAAGHWCGWQGSGRLLSMSPACACAPSPGGWSLLQAPHVCPLAWPLCTGEEEAVDNAGTTAAAAVTEADRIKGLGYHASMTTGEAGMAGCRFCSGILL